MLPQMSRTITPCAATAIDRNRTLPLFESLIYVIIAGLLFALPIMIPLLHPSSAAAGTATVVAYADEIDAMLAEADDARQAVDAYLAVIGNDCASSRGDDRPSVTASSDQASGGSATSKPMAMSHCLGAKIAGSD